MRRTRLPLRASALAVSTAVLGASLVAPALAQAGAATGRDVHPGHGRSDAAPFVIAHRGASGYRPEHTLAAYELAIEQGADAIEPDLVMTRDGALIDRHDNRLDLTTDVADRPEFADRRTTKVVDGVEQTGWFSEDFTLAEVKTLRAVERIPEVRPDNTAYDGRYEVPTLQEVIDLVRAHERETGEVVAIYPETKHPTYFADLGLDLDAALVEVLDANGYDAADDPVFVQSFEVGNLQRLDRMTDVRLVQLLWLEGQPADVAASGGTLTYDEMATPRGLHRIARYADGVGPEKEHFILPRGEDGQLDPGNATTFVRDAHAAGLLVHPYTFRAENRYLPTDLRSGSDPNAHGDLAAEIEAYLEVGVDGFFTDFPDLGRAAADAFVRERADERPGGQARRR